MKLKQLFTLAALLTSGTLAAQDIYKAEALTGIDLNGTARYVGMGGAMSALGADLSVMGTNPAGTGLYRRSDVSFTGSATVQPNGIEFGDLTKARGSFDQAGFVYAARLDDESVKFFNFGFNYQKRRNFKNTIEVLGHATDGWSQSYQLADLCYVGGRLNNGWLDLDLDADRDYTTPLTLVGYDTYLIDKRYDDEGNLAGYDGWDADSYSYRRAQWGGIESYDFNFSVNISDRYYVGTTIGVYNVNMKTTTDYVEALRFSDGSTQNYYMSNSEVLNGTGFDFKFGAIVRPIEDSPLRLGFAFSTPVFYNLTQSAYVYGNTPYAPEGSGYDYSEQDIETGDNDYRFRTPWRINLSLATTVGRRLAFDAEYEIARYAGGHFSYPDYGDGEYWYDSWSGGSADKALNGEIDRFLKPVHTFRVGAELMLGKHVALRGGYNYVSAPFEKDAYLNLFTESPSYYFSTNTDYVNLGAIHRATAGLGFRAKSFYFDLAYQYQRQSGDLYAFHLPSDAGEENILTAEKVDLNRHNIMATMGFKF